MCDSVVGERVCVCVFGSRPELQAIYREHAPHRLSDDPQFLDKLLEGHTGKEHELMHKVSA